VSEGSAREAGSRCGSDQKPFPTPATVSTYFYGLLVLGEIAKVPAHSCAKPELGLCEDTDSSPRAGTLVPDDTAGHDTGFREGIAPPRLDVAPGLVRDAGREGTADHARGGDPGPREGQSQVKMHSPGYIEQCATGPSCPARGGGGGGRRPTGLPRLGRHGRPGGARRR